jgi:sortase A
MRNLQPGAIVTATTGQGVFTYVVDRVRRAGDEVPAPLKAGGARLLLVTSEGEGWRSGWAPTSTVYVDATLRGDPQPAPGGRVGAVPSGEKPMGRDSASLLPLMLWLQAFLVASAVLVWAWYRWGRWQTWLVGLPVLLAVLWGMAENTLALLPNLT